MLQITYTDRFKKHYRNLSDLVALIDIGHHNILKKY